MLQVMSLAANLKAPMALLCSIAFGGGGPAIAPLPDWSHLPPIPARTTTNREGGLIGILSLNFVFPLLTNSFIAMQTTTCDSLNSLFDATMEV